MKISKLLELHVQNSDAHSLTTNFGDGYLLKNNRIYRNIRTLAVQNGYTYSDKPDRDYASLPFSQLERILDTRKVPFTDNVTVLENLARRHPFLQWEDLSDGLKKNYVFHESCHAVIRSADDGAALTDERKLAFKMLLEESFANVCELIAVIDAQDAAHRVFYEANSYTALFSDRSNFQRACDEIGEGMVFQFLWIAYLHSNFLKVPDERAWQRMLGLTKAPASQVRTLKAIAKIAFTLDLNFRTKTTQLHLQLSGLETPLDKLINFDFLSELETAQNKKLLKDLTQQVLS
ncbi:MAG: hypothetical protein H7326_08400 [Bdellovibrionaceae bacterium]|nr:hypothetical protein [Pseudobdellovibrionaceae bacterium]